MKVTLNMSVAVAILGGAGIAAFAQPTPQATEPFTINIEGPTDPTVRHDRIIIRKGTFEGPDEKAAPGVRALPRFADAHFISADFGIPGEVVKGAPYQAEAVTESTQVFSDGNRIVHKTSLVTYRDSEGRTRRESSIGNIGPWASPNQGAKIIFIHDPVENVSYTLQEHDKTARKMAGHGMVVQFASGMGGGMGGMVAAAPVAGAIQANRVLEKDLHVRDMKARADAGVKTESLGTRIIEGVKAEGTRMTHTIPAGEIGNERPMEVVTENWFSPELKLQVMTRHSDPRMGETVYKLTNLRREEPVRSLFDVPADYTLVTENVPERTREVRRPIAK